MSDSDTKYYPVLALFLLSPGYATYRIAIVRSAETLSAEQFPWHIAMDDLFTSHDGRQWNVLGGADCAPVTKKRLIALKELEGQVAEFKEKNPDAVIQLITEIDIDLQPGRVLPSPHRRYVAQYIPEKR